MMARSNESGDCMDLTGGHLYAAAGMRGASAFLCTIICCVALWVFCCIKQGGFNIDLNLCYEKCFIHRLVMYLITVTFVYNLMSMAQLFALLKSQILCKCLGFLEQFLSWIQLLVAMWVVGYFSYDYYHGTLEQEVPVFWKEILPWTLMLLWSATVSIVPVVSGTYGPTGGWCWISDKHHNCNTDKEGIAYQWLLWYVWVAFFMVIICLLLCYATCTARKNCLYYKNRADPELDEVHDKEKKHACNFCILLTSYIPIYAIFTLFEVITRALYQAHGVGVLWGIFAFFTQFGTIAVVWAAIWYLKTIGGFDREGYECL